MADAIFEACLICDSIHLESKHKATILGFLGLTPNVNIKVANTNAPLTELSFLFVSKPLAELRSYHVGLSIKDPAGVLMFPVAEQAISLTKPERINLGYSFRPFKITGSGTYNVYLLVDDKRDLETNFSIVQAEPGELV
jgi:hypothetical protein